LSVRENVRAGEPVHILAYYGTCGPSNCILQLVLHSSETCHRECCLELPEQRGGGGEGPAALLRWQEPEQPLLLG